MRLLLCGVLLSFSLCASAEEQIQIDFHSDSDTHFATPAAAQPATQGQLVNTETTTWNRITNMAGTAFNAGKNGYKFSHIPLKRADGTASSAKISGVIGYSATNPLDWKNKTKDEVMMAGWFGLRASEFITVTDLPIIYTQGFTIVVYGDSSSTTIRAMPYTVGTTTRTLEDRGTFSGTFREGVNFVVFRGLTGSAFTITGQPSATAERSAINGMIILAGNRLP